MRKEKRGAREVPEKVRGKVKENAGEGDARCVEKETVRGGVREGEIGSMREVRGEVSAEVFDFSDLK